MENDAAGKPGTLIAIGGAEDKRGERLILRRFVTAAGGADARLMVLATASEVAGTALRYTRLFHQLDAGSVDVLEVDNRADALRAGAAALAALRSATGLFLTGGNQLKLSSALGGTALARAIQERHAEGMVVGGTSAGAALLAEHMIALGSGGGTPRRQLVQLAQGLGLAPDLVIDQHFRRQDRLGRLLTALSYNPAPLGLGIDENTAAIIDDGAMTVLGTGAVTVVDASAMRFTNSYSVPRGHSLAMLGLKLDFLTNGCRYDLRRRVGLPSAAADLASVQPGDSLEAIPYYTS